MGHFVSVLGRGSGHQFPRLQDIKVRIWAGGGVLFPALSHYFRQVSTIFSSQNDNHSLVTRAMIHHSWATARPWLLGSFFLIKYIFNILFHLIF